MRKATMKLPENDTEKYLQENEVNENFHNSGEKHQQLGSDRTVSQTLPSPKTPLKTKENAHLLTLSPTLDAEIVR